MAKKTKLLVAAQFDSHLGKFSSVFVATKRLCFSQDIRSSLSVVLATRRGILSQTLTFSSFLLLYFYAQT